MRWNHFISRKNIFSLIAAVIFFTIAGVTGLLYKNTWVRSQVLSHENKVLTQNLHKTQQELDSLKKENQYVINQQNLEKIKQIQTTYKKAVTTYERLQDLKAVGGKTEKLDELYARVLTYLAEENFSSGEAMLAMLAQQIQSEKEKISTPTQAGANTPVQNSAPGSGFSAQRVETDAGTFLVSIIAADLASTKVIVDTASDGDCKDNCPVLSLGDYVSRSGAFAGVNGTYFCPSSYPSCADKKNTFDVLVMNKNKVYFNSANNVYSEVPAVIFSGNSARFVGKSLEWGRDKGVDAVIANRPLLVSNGQVAFGGSSGEAKENIRGGRSFVGASGSTAYIGVVFNASLDEAAKVLHTMGVQNAINLDDGGSVALWSSGYKAGPGRAIPNAILFVHK